MFAAPFKRAIRGRMLWFTADPVEEGARAYRYLADGIMLIRNGMIVALGEALGLSRSDWGWDLKLADFANDGRLELVQATGFVRGSVNRWPG